MRESAYLLHLTSTSAGAARGPRAPWWMRVTRLDSQKLSQDESSMRRRLLRAGIPISPQLYTTLCTTLGVTFGVSCLPYGPLLAAVVGVALTYELLVSYPTDRAARRERAVAKDLPLCAEVIGAQVNSGAPLASALVHSLQALPKGVLSTHIARLVEAIQRGVPIKSALHGLQDALPGPDIRMFTSTISIFCTGGNQYGEPLLRYAAFVRKHRLVTDGVARRVGTIRQLFAALLSVVALVVAWVQQWIDPRILNSPDATYAVTREIGGILIVGALIAVMRLTASRSWEVPDAG